MLINEIITSLMEDAKLYLRQLETSAYTSPIPVLSNSTIGQHTRHFIEFFQCLLQQYSTGVVNYDQRQRNKQIEIEPAFAIATINSILDTLPKKAPEQALILESDYGIECATCVSVDSNFHRELVYNVEHTIHHLAIIKIGLLSIMPEIALPEHFGVAPSTVKHQTIAA